MKIDRRKGLLAAYSKLGPMNRFLTKLAMLGVLLACVFFAIQCHTGVTKKDLSSASKEIAGSFRHHAEPTPYLTAKLCFYRVTNTNLSFEVVLYNSGSSLIRNVRPEFQFNNRLNMLGVSGGRYPLDIAPTTSQILEHPLFSVTNMGELSDFEMYCTYDIFTNGVKDMRCSRHAMPSLLPLVAQGDSVLLRSTYDVNPRYPEELLNTDFVNALDNDQGFICGVIELTNTSSRSPYSLFGNLQKMLLVDPSKNSLLFCMQSTNGTPIVVTQQVESVKGVFLLSLSWDIQNGTADLRAYGPNDKSLTPEGLRR